MVEVMEQRLAAKKRELERQQEYFRIDIKNMDSATYEDNAISSLLEIKKLKTEVAELEFCLQLKWLIYREVDMREQEVKEIISVEILKRMSDQSAADALREILFNEDNKIDWEKAGFSIIENMPELKMFE